MPKLFLQPLKGARDRKLPLIWAHTAKLAKLAC